jgi:endoglycosylceramidase
MYRRLHLDIRKIDDEHIIFYEPAVSDIDIIGFEEGPGGHAYDNRQALSYHMYCSAVDTQGNPRSEFLCRVLDDEQFKWRESASKRIGGGRFLTEFGALSDQPKSVHETNWILNEAEKRLHSWTYWQFKYYQDFTTAVMPGNGESFYAPDGSLYQNKVKALSRTYAQAVCGVASASLFNPTTAVYALNYTSIDC